MHICDVFKPSTNVWYIFQASTGDFPAVCVGRGGGNKCKIDMSGYPTMHICDVFKPSDNVWNIFLAIPGDFPVTSGGG